MKNAKTVDFGEASVAADILPRLVTAASSAQQQKQKLGVGSGSNRARNSLGRSL